MSKLFFASILSLFLLGAGCASTQQMTAAVDPSTIKTGDVISGLKVTTVGGVPGIEMPFSYGDVPNIHIEFSGQATVTGEYHYDKNEFFGQDLTTFQVSDPQEMKKLPHLKEQEPVLFWFSNREEANQALGPKYGKGQATIQIESYEINYAGAEVMNSAKLVKVVSK